MVVWEETVVEKGKDWGGGGMYKPEKMERRYKMGQSLVSSCCSVYLADKVFSNWSLQSILSS